MNLAALAAETLCDMNKNDIANLNKVVGKHFVSNVQDEKLISNEEITKEKYERISQYNLEIRQLLFYLGKCFECQENLKDYFERIQDYSLIKADEVYSGRLNPDDIRMNLNRLFNNFVSSFKGMLEHSEKKIRRDYGTDTQELVEFKAWSAENYDKYFSYRLLIRLRNYTMHYGQALSLRIAGKGNQLERFEPYIIKENILRFREIKSKLKGDLRLYAPTFPISPILDEIKPVIEEFNHAIVKILFSRKKDVLDYLIGFINRYIEDDKYSLRLSHYRSLRGNSLDVDMINVDKDLILFAKQSLD